MKARRSSFHRNASVKTVAIVSILLVLVFLVLPAAAAGGGTEKQSKTGTQVVDASKSKPQDSGETISAKSFRGNTKSLKFHRPGCRHYNCPTCTMVFSSREKAILAGFAPCKLCKP